MAIYFRTLDRSCTENRQNVSFSLVAKSVLNGPRRYCDYSILADLFMFATFWYLLSITLIVLTFLSLWYVYVPVSTRVKGLNFRNKELRFDIKLDGI